MLSGYVVSTNLSRDNIDSRCSIRCDAMRCDAMLCDTVNGICPHRDATRCRAQGRNAARRHTSVALRCAAGHCIAQRQSDERQHIFKMRTADPHVHVLAELILVGNGISTW